MQAAKRLFFTVTIMAAIVIRGLMHEAYAENVEIGETAKGEALSVITNETIEADHEIEFVDVNELRERNLREFLERYNSPLVNNIDTLLEVSDRYGMDYRLIVSIAGVESTFCKHIIPGSYNCYGWGIYGDNVIRFESYEDGIQKLAAGLSKGYMDKGAVTVEQIGYIYNPGNPVNWSGKVRFFMNQMHEITL